MPIRIELEDVLDAGIGAVEAHHLGDALIRFRLAEPPAPSPYHEAILAGSDTALILPAAPNRAAVDHNFDAIRRELAQAFTAHRRAPLLWKANVGSAEDFLRFNIDHYCSPLWLYTNGQIVASLVERQPQAFEVFVHPSVYDYFLFGSTFGPWPVVDVARGGRFASLIAAETWIGQRLSNIRVQRLSVSHGPERRSVFLQPVGRRTYVLHYWGNARREKIAPDEMHAFLNALDLDGFRARACATCVHFGFSGMSRDMSSGMKGYCAHRRDDPETELPVGALVSVSDLCEHHEPAGPAVTAESIAKIMAANLRENREDPDFMRRQAKLDDAITREVLARHGLQPSVGKPLARGRDADLFLAFRGGRRVVIKVARVRSQTQGPLKPLAEHEALFTTGLVVFGDPDPDEVVRCEAEALSALAPATPRVIESGVRDDGRAYVVREYVEGETWRESLARKAPTNIIALSALVDLLAAVEESGPPGFHGDVKPDNIITTSNDAVVLIDPTSAFARRDEGGSLQRALVTGEYNPRLAASDHAAVALTLIEMLTGRQLIVDAAASVVFRPISARLSESLRFAASMGADLFARRLPAILLPSEIKPSLAGPVEDLLLRCLGLSVDRGVLDTGEPLQSLREFDKMFWWSLARGLMREL